MEKNGCNIWRPVVLPGTALVGLNSSFLGGIEVLSEYNVLSANEKSYRVQKKRKKTVKVRDERKKNPVYNVFTVKEVEPVHENFELEYSAWENIYVPREIARPLLEIGYEHPTEIQRMCIPAAIKGRRDLLGAAETGSGKTLAFGIPMIYGIMKQLQIISEKEGKFESTDKVTVTSYVEGESKGQRLWGLVLTPTRELAIQIKDHLERAAKYTPVTVSVIIGGMSSAKQERLLNKHPHIVVATPGRLWDLLSHPHLAAIQNIRYLAVDETDRMLESEHFPELTKLLEKINVDAASKKLRQIFVFSATLAYVHEPPKHLYKKRKKVIKLTPEEKLNRIIHLLGITNPKIVDITKSQGMPEKLLESQILCSHEDKDVYLLYFIFKFPGRTLIFCNSITCVRRLTSVLGILKVEPLPLHAEMHQRQRLKNLDRFKENPKGLLIATDVAARGLDIPNVQHVVHYQVPRTTENYIHRSGRTARAEKEGLTLILVEPSEMNLYTKLCTALDKQNVQTFPVDNSYIIKMKEVMKCAREIDHIEKNTRVTTSKITWVKKTAQDLDIMLDDDERPREPDPAETALNRKKVEKKKKILKDLLRSPLITEAQQEFLSAIDIAKTSEPKKKRKATSQTNFAKISLPKKKK